MERTEMDKNSDGKIHVIGDLIYPFMLDFIERYQKNYTGSDKMTKESMMKEIERFKADERED